MENKKRILVVDDEQQINLVLRSGLTKHGYDTRVAAEGESALELFNAWTPDLVVTDLSMPNMDGLELCRRIRAVSQIPIIVLSVKGEEKIKVEALDAGADDYVTKPFGIEELLARVRAALRRAQAQRDDEAVVCVGGIQLDQIARRVTIDGQQVHLTPTQYELLRVFINNPDRVLTQRALLVLTFGPAYEAAVDNLRTFVAQLRRKVERDPSRPQRIVTEPGVGYRFRSEAV